MDSKHLSYPQLCGLLAVNPTTYSQVMHNAGFSALNLPFTYVAFDTQDTAAGIAAMRALGIRGYSLTIPHKENAMILVDTVSPDGNEIGAINTVINNGVSLVGYNTDWVGIVRAFAEVGQSFEGKRVLLIGAGGAARAALYAAHKQSASSIHISNRTIERAQLLASEFGCHVCPIEELARIRDHEFDIIINSTPIGSKLAPNEKHFFDLSWLSPHHIVFDMVTCDTDLIRTAMANGAVAIHGFRMLLAQAVEQFKLFTEQDAPIEAMEKALYKEIKLQ